MMLNILNIKLNNYIIMKKYLFVFLYGNNLDSISNIEEIRDWNLLIIL